MASTSPVWHGVYPAAITHFRDDDSLDIPATLTHLDVMLEAGVHGMVVLGSVGENYTLTPEEKLDVLRASVEHIRGRVPVLTGVAENSTSLACDFASRAQEIGADGLMVLPAMIYKSDARETMAHFRAVAAASELPIMIYNNPLAYHVDCTPAMFAELADEPKFAAIKESSGDVRRITDLKNLVGGRYILFSGVDDLVLEACCSARPAGFPVWSTRFRTKIASSGTSPRRGSGMLHCRSIAGTCRCSTWIPT